MPAPGRVQKDKDATDVLFQRRDEFVTFVRCAADPRIGKCRNSNRRIVSASRGRALRGCLPAEEFNLPRTCSSV